MSFDKRRRKSSFLGASCGLSLVASPLPSVPQALGRSRLQRPWLPGRLNGHCSAASGRLQGLATGCCTRRRPGLQSQVREDLLDHRLLQNRRDDLQLAAAVWVVLHVDVEHALEQLGPAQPRRAAATAPRNRQAVWPASGLSACATDRFRAVNSRWAMSLQGRQEPFGLLPASRHPDVSNCASTVGLGRVGTTAPGRGVRCHRGCPLAR